MTIGEENERHSNVVQEVSALNPFAHEIVQSASDGMIATDTAGTICLSNSAAQRLTGYSIEEARGRPLSSLITLVDESTGRLVPDPVARCIKTDDMVTLGNHDVLVTRGGLQVPIAGSAKPLRNKNGKTIGAIFVIREVTATRLLMRRISYAP